MFDLFIEIGQSLRRNKFRTAMTGFAVSWGIFILVVLLGASSGLQHGMEKNYAGRMQNSVTIQSGYTDLPFKGMPRWREIQITPNAYSILEARPEVTLISPVGQQSLNVRYQDEETTMNVKGVGAQYGQIRKAEMLTGRHFLPIDFQEAHKVAIVNERAINDICNGDRSIVGNYIQIGGIFYRVIGIVKDKEAWGGSEVQIPYPLYQKLYQPDGKMGRVEMVLRAGTKDFKTTVKRELSPVLYFDPEDESALWVTDYEEDFATVQKVMWALKIFILIVSICTLISGAVGVSNIMLVSVRERTKELGIRKALGAPPMSIMQSVVGEALLITSIFGLIGGLLGSGVVALIGKMTANAEQQVFLNPSVDAFTIAAATLILIAVGVIAGAIPAAKAMKVKPIEAMNADK